MLPGVSKTAILTLRARADEHGREDRVFEDPVAVDWWTRVTWPSDLDAWYGPAAQYALAFRADDIDRIVLRYAQTTSVSSIVELGCGLSTRRSRLRDLPISSWIDVDLPAVVDLRRSWDGDSESHRHVPCSVLDYSWMDHIGGDPSAQIFVAEGLLYYLPRAKVDDLLRTMRQRFEGSVILMDVLGANDYPVLLENTTAVGTPIQWKYEGEFDDVLEAFQLAQIEDFEPDRLTHEALDRYWHRFDAKTRGAIYFAMSSVLAQSRSGMVLGRLTPR